MNKKVITTKQSFFFLSLSLCLEHFFVVFCFVLFCERASTLVVVSDAYSDDDDAAASFSCYLHLLLLLLITKHKLLFLLLLLLLQVSIKYGKERGLCCGDVSKRSSC